MKAIASSLLSRDGPSQINTLAAVVYIVHIEDT
jgi:hypothetical protein